MAETLWMETQGVRTNRISWNSIKMKEKPQKATRLENDNNRPQKDPFTGGVPKISDDFGQQ